MRFHLRGVIQRHGWAVVPVEGAGFIAYLMSQPIVLGFTSAAGVVIFASQVPVVLGVGSTNDNPFVAAIDALRAPGEWEAASIVLSVVVAIVILGGKRIHTLFPGVLIAVGAAILWSVTVDYSGRTRARGPHRSARDQEVARRGALRGPEGVRRGCTPASRAR